jgi:peptidoglycan hydrolase CwlO-like protein
LSELLNKKEKFDSELKEILGKIDEIKKIANDLKKEKNKNKKREAIWKKFKEMGWDVGQFEDFLDAVKRSNPDNYQQ